MTAATPASAISPTIPDASPPPAEPALRLARLTVDPAAVVRNWRAMAALPGGAEAAGVVKADAYGLGADAIGPALAAAGCATFFVAALGEGLALRAALGPGPAIYVLNGLGPADAPAMRAAGLRPVLNSLSEVARWRDAAGWPAALHIDTGMSRLGLAPAEVGPAADLLAEAPPALVLSHLACASDPGHAQNAQQLARFRACAALFPKAKRSLAASAGALLGTAYRFDLIRPGIALYGDHGLDAPAGPDAPALAVAARFEAPVLQLRTIAAGDPVGYGATVRAPQPMRLATLDAGYADGLLRSLSGRGYGWAAGRRRPFVGRVSMDLIVIDVSDGAAPEVGEAVELLGPHVPLAEVAAAAGTASYEVLTALGAASRRSFGPLGA